MKKFLLLSLSGLFFLVAHADHDFAQVDARQAAIDILADYAEFSRIYDYDGVDQSDKFKALFSLNALLPLDYQLDKADQFVSPTKYASEYQLMGIGQAIPVNTKLVAKSISVSPQKGGEGFNVIVLATRTFGAELIDGQWKASATPREYTQQVEVVVDQNKMAKINRITRYVKPAAEAWSADIYAMSNLASPEFSIANSNLAGGNYDPDFSLSNIGLRFNYYFNPFSSAGQDQKVTLMVGAGLENWRYKIAAETLTITDANYDPSLQVVEYTESGQPGSDVENGNIFDHKLAINFEDEVINALLFTGRLGAKYTLKETNKSSSSVELGLGLSGGTTKSVDLTRTSNETATFAQDYFAGNAGPIVISDNQVTHNGETVTFAVSESINEIYGFSASNDDPQYDISFTSTVFLDATFTQLIKFDAIDLGAFITVRRHFNSPLSDYEDSNTSLQDVLSNGLPRLTAFTGKLNPTYIGLGIRIQKSR